MTTDENKRIFDLSGHSMIEVKMNLGTASAVKKKKWIETKYYTVLDEPMGRFRKNIEENIREMKIENMAENCKILRKAAGDTLERKYKKQERLSFEEKVIKERPWFTEEI